MGVYVCGEPISLLFYFSTAEIRIFVILVADNGIPPPAHRTINVEVHCELKK